jgi:thiaminase
MTVSSAPIDLLATIRRELAPAEGGNRLVQLVAEGRLPRERLVALAGEEYQIIRSDRRSFLVLAARFPEPPAAEFFTGLAGGETLALDHLMGFAAALGMDQNDLERYEPRPGCQTYPSYVSWLALNGAPGDVALALIANFGAWSSYCGAVAESLRSRYGFDDKACAFFDFFATPVPEVEEQALAVATASTAAGEPPTLARRYARLIQAYELDFWNTLAEGIPETA